MTIEKNYSLQALNTFGIAASAQYFAVFNHVAALSSVLAEAKLKNMNAMPQPLIIGGGSNILFTKDIEGWVLKNNILGIEIIDETDTHVYVKAGAGVVWHEFVMWCVAKGFGGVENLSLIPGSVGASPMQNIGAYGVEIKDVFHSVETYMLSDGHIATLDKSACAFGYRESIFKKELKQKTVITSVTYKLTKQPVFNTSYGAIEQELDKMGVAALSIKAVSDAVIRIRQSKLPDPKDIGNAGSFFKNPEISLAQFEPLQLAQPGIVGYQLSNGNVKVAAGWLIEKAGFKGKVWGNTGCDAKQALVLVNYGNATGKEILDHSTRVIDSIKAQFGIELEREVNIY